MSLTKAIEAALKQQAKKIEDEIYKRSKRGKGVSNHGDNPRPFKNLSDSYVKQRQSLERNGKLDSSTRPGMSNITQTGKMLRDLEVTATDQGLSIGFRSQQSKTKADYVEEDRPFTNLDARQAQELEQVITDAASKEIADQIKKLTR